MNSELLVRLCADAFVRCHGDVGYITSQLTKHDRLYDDAGAVFLSALSREPQRVGDLATRIAAGFVDATPADVADDLGDFLATLSEEGFIVIGGTAAECDALEPRFRYADAEAIIATKKRLAVALDPDANGGLSDTQTELSRRNQSDPWLADLQVELTAACNERCLHCYQPLALREKGHADPALVRRVIDEFAAMGGLSFSFSGGECLLHPDFADLLHYARSRDLSVAILSNLTALDDRLLTAIRDARIAQIQVSVYSLRGEEHDHITRAPGSLRRTLDAINRLVAADVPVQVSCPVMRTNHRSYKDVLSWARERSMKAHTDFILMARSDFSKDNLDERLNDEETRDLLRDILAVDRDYTDDITGRDPLDTPDAPVCGVGQGTICMAADGVFYPCSGWQGYAVGDANSQSLAEIWRDSPQLSGLRRLTKASFPACRACEDRDYCAMCLVRNFNESDGDMMRVSKRFCEIARINRQIVEDWKRTRGVPQRVGQP